MVVYLSKAAARDARRRSRQEQADREAAEREEECRRRAALPMFLRIEEADASADAREILHMMAEKLGME